jgi:sugar phosphate isomerase/epimerase
MGYGIFFDHLKKEAQRRNCPLPQIIEGAKALGADRATLDAKNLSRDLPVLTENGMRINIVYCVCGLIHGKELDAALQAAEDTAKAGGKILMLVPGFYEEGQSYRSALQRAVPLLKRVVAECGGLGICPAIEDFGGRLTPYSLVPQIKGILDEVEGLQFVFDSGNVLYHRQDPLALWDATEDRIVAVHAKDLTTRPQEGISPVLSPARDELWPAAFGEGDLPAAELRRRIRDKGIPPEGITLEHDGAGAPDTLEFLRRSVAFLKG